MWWDIFADFIAELVGELFDGRQRRNKRRKRRR
jgi:hypothetical protein